MEFDTFFTVPLAPPEAWTLLLDIERIAPCMPGAELTEVVDPTTYKGKISVKLGPVALAFTGQVKFEDIDQVNHKARVKAQGADAKGRGGANATADFHLEPIGQGTKVLIHTNLMLSGAVAQYGRGAGMIQDLASHMVGQFADRLKAMLAADAPPVASSEGTRSSPPSGTARAPAAPIAGFSLMFKMSWHAILRMFGAGRERSGMICYRIVKPVLKLLTPEAAHRAAILGLKLGLAGRSHEPDDPILATTVLGLRFPNPVGVAAGFDKGAEVPDAMLALGFGFTEAGTVTPKPQPGNPKPRLFRLDEDQGVINRLGFNSDGLEPYLARIKARKARGAMGIFGANVGKNRDTQDGAADYAIGIEAVCSYADYLVCNISSPNTPGLRNLQGRAQLHDLLTRVQAARQRAVTQGGKAPPLFAKVGPDLDVIAIQDIAEVALETRVDGLIIGNTTIGRPASLKSRDAQEAGGLSGKPLTEKARWCLGEMYKAVGGRIPIVGCGGIMNGDDAYRRIRAGASLVQLYSALVFQGPELVVSIKHDLAKRLRADGFASVADAVGADHR